MSRVKVAAAFRLLPRMRLLGLLLRSLAVCAMFMAFVAGQPACASGGRAPYLIFHLDGVSSETFFEELRAGHLPNIEAAFAGGACIEDALSLFPGGTEMIYPRLKNGHESKDNYQVAWRAYDRRSGEVIGRLQVIPELFSHLPRISRSQWSYGAPGVEAFGGWALQNVPRLLRDYEFLEFFWFATDSWGHWFGEEAQKASMRRFDRYLGDALRRLGDKPVNLVLYADHGMSFSTETVDLETAVDLALGGSARFYFYPNVYLNASADVARAAQALAARPEIDFAFYRLDEHTVAGCHKEGTMFFEETDAGIRYSTEGPDPLGYDRLGYKGEPLSDDEWLRLTCRSRFPAVPANVYRYMLNALAGDVVIVVNPPKRPRDLVSHHGSHAGLTATDLLVPVLLKGPDIDPLRISGPFWLHRLYRDVLQVNPALETGPSREDCHVRIAVTMLESPDSRGATAAGGMGGAAQGQSGQTSRPASVLKPSQAFSCPVSFSLSLSLAPRRRLTAMTLPGGWSSFFEYDVHRSFIMTAWAGFGMRGTPGAGLSPVASMRLSLFVNELSLETLALCSPRDACDYFQVRVSYELRPGLTLDWTAPGTIGVSFHW